MLMPARQQQRFKEVAAFRAVEEGQPQQDRGYQMV